jgi:alpha-amylase
MSAIHLYFQVHQPYRLNEFTFFDIGNSQNYFNDFLNESIINKVCEKCYLPTNSLLLNLIEEFKGDFKCTFSFSGVFLEQIQKTRPDVLDSFRKLVDSGCVEVLSETYYHSLSSIYDLEEFDQQVLLHKNLIGNLFGYVPNVFRNTELIVHEEVLKYCQKNNYIGLLVEGSKNLLGDHSPNQMIIPQGYEFKVLARNFELSDEISYRFSDQKNPLYPLTVDKFIDLILHEQPNDCINLYMDYETFGEHHWVDTHIFDFLEMLPRSIMNAASFEFKKMEDTLAGKTEAKTSVKFEGASSWADTEKDLSAWIGNSLQQDALRLIYELKDPVFATGNNNMIDLWRKLQTSDHFYYMSTKAYTDGEVHNYFSPYRSPYDAYLYYTNVLKSVRQTLGIN